MWRRETDAELIGFREEFKAFDKAEIHHEDLIGRYRTYGEEIVGKFRRGNVGLILGLEHESGAKIIVANSHLHWNPKFDFVKYAQAFWLQKSVADFVETRNLDDVPIIICGDFNSKPGDSAIYAMYNQPVCLREDQKAYEK